MVLKKSRKRKTQEPNKCDSGTHPAGVRLELEIFVHPTKNLWANPTHPHSVPHWPSKDSHEHSIPSIRTSGADFLTCLLHSPVSKLILHLGLAVLFCHFCILVQSTDLIFLAQSLALWRNFHTFWLSPPLSLSRENISTWP